MAAVEIQNLAKTYLTRDRKGLFKSEKREVPALKDVSFNVEPGEVFGLLGPNGAGKTTLIKILTTLLLPTSGQAWVNGHQVVKEADQVRASVGCMLMGERGLYWKLTARENLEYFAALYHIRPERVKDRVKEILEIISFQEIADRTVETYSSGQKMKLAFGKALINDAPILVLDEPTNTLDVPSASELRGVVRQLNTQGKTIIYTTHIMQEAEVLCNRVAIVDQGKLLALGSVPELKTSLGRDQVTRIEGVIPGKAFQAVKQLPGVVRASLSVEEGRNELTVVSSGENILAHLIETLTEHECTILRISPEEVTLEDVFIAKTGRTLAQDTRKGGTK